jgi:hypothetical protein
VIGKTNPQRTLSLVLLLRNIWKARIFAWESTSWLALNEIIGGICLVEPITPIAKIIECKINAGTSGSTTGFEQITSGIIRIRGVLKRASFVATDKVL